MSAFGFTDGPVQNSGDGDESLFNFADSQQEDGGNATEFSFGSEPPQASQQASGDLFEGTDREIPKKQVKKKPLSRVMGMKNKKPKKATKAPKFAKKDGTEPVGKGLFAMKSKNFTSSEVHDSEASESDQHDSEPPIERQQDVNSFLSDPNLNQQQPETSAFNFGFATDTQPQQHEESAFNFGQAEEEPPHSVNQPQTTFSPPPEQPMVLPQQPSVSPQGSFSSQQPPLSPQTSLSSKSGTQSVEDIMLDGDLNEECITFVRQLEQYSKNLENAQNSYDKCTTNLKDMESQQADALQNEQFDIADQLNSKITNTRAQMLVSQTSFNKTIADAMALANQAPQHFIDHSEEAQTELPTLQVRKQALDRRLLDLKNEQSVDQKTIEIERKKNETLIESLKKPVREHEEMHKEMETNLKDEIEASKKPFIEALDSLSKDQKSHEDSIADLQKQIELHKKEIAEIQKKISTNQRQMKAAVESFDNDKVTLENDRKQLENEHVELETKIKEIEAPFQSLVDTVDKREAEINGVSTAIEKITQQIDEGEKDSKGCVSAATIINKLCQEHYRYDEQRQKTKDRFDTAIQNSKNYEKRRDEINDETIELRGKAQRAAEFLNNAKLKVPQLEASKKAAVASKNFKGAQQINKELTSINDQISVNEKLVVEENQRLEKLEAEASSITSEIAKAQVEVEESKLALLQMDYNFFQMANESTQKLCELSPFGEKLLRPLVKMIKFALDHTEVPKQLNAEDLQDEIDKLTQEQEKAINDEDFDKAEALEGKLTALKAKLSVLKPQDNQNDAKQKVDENHGEEEEANPNGQ